MLGFYAVSTMPGGPRWEGAEIFAVVVIPVISIGVGWAVRDIFIESAGLGTTISAHDSTVSDAVLAMGALVKAVAEGDLTPTGAAEPPWSTPDRPGKLIVFRIIVTPKGATCAT